MTLQPRRRAVRKRPAADENLAQGLGLLGKARLANNLNQLAKAANCGAPPVTPETEKDLQEACAEIRWMRQALMEALGLQA